MRERERGVVRRFLSSLLSVFVLYCMAGSEPGRLVVYIWARYYGLDDTNVSGVVRWTYVLLDARNARMMHILYPRPNVETKIRKLANKSRSIHITPQDAQFVSTFVRSISIFVDDFIQFKWLILDFYKRTSIQLLYIPFGKRKVKYSCEEAKTTLSWSSTHLNL